MVEQEEEKQEEKEGEKQSHLRDRDFTWESLASVEISRQNQLISEVYSLMNAFDDERIEFIKKEWASLSEEGIDADLEARFQEALEKYEKRFENITGAQAKKRELIKEAEALKDSTAWAKTAEIMHNLQDQWREAGYAGQEIDQELWEQFSAAKNAFFDHRKENYEHMRENHANAAGLKETLIAQAEALQDSTDWKETSEIMHKLMDDWKEAGFAGREVDQELWERFNAARQKFFVSQKEHFDQLRAMYAEAKKRKEEIIEEARTLKDSTEYAETRDAFTKLFERWKEIGSAGRKHEQKLWEMFKSYQDEFYDRYKASQNSDREARKELTAEDLERLDVRIQALEQLNSMIDIKIENLESAHANTMTPEIEAEIASLKQNKLDNDEKLETYYQERDALEH